jgi:SAM-dependent methyltransferase
MAKEHSIEPASFAPILADLAIAQEAVTFLDTSELSASGGETKRGAGDVMLGPVGAGLDPATAVVIHRRHVDPRLAPDGTLLLYFAGPREDREFARWRNALWPWLHVVAVYRLRGGAVKRETLHERVEIAGRPQVDGTVLVARRREHVMSQKLTTVKFDTNAGGWNGEPGRPGYAHFRWMRRYVGRFAPVRDRARVLDFGCGAGWVGIEAALQAKDVELCSFDPSPEMVRIAGDNARGAGVTRFDARVGFGEAPPFPAAGEKRFDVVFSSGVVSFSPDIERWTDGLVATLADGATLVIGDIQRESRGMQKRRSRRVLLPAREMNAQIAEEMRARLEKRGLVHEATAGYQLSDPIPQLTHHADKKLGGVLSPILLGLNRLAAGNTLSPKQFDSWVMRFKKR